MRTGTYNDSRVLEYTLSKPGKYAPISISLPSDIDELRFRVIHKEALVVGYSFDMAFQQDLLPLVDQTIPNPKPSTNFNIFGRALTPRNTMASGEWVILRDVKQIPHQLFIFLCDISEAGENWTLRVEWQITGGRNNGN